MIHRKENGQLKAKAGLGIVDNILSTLSNNAISNRAVALKFGEIDALLGVTTSNVIFDNPDGAVGTITLLDRPNNYKYIDVTFRSNDNVIFVKRFRGDTAGIDVSMNRVQNNNIYVKGAKWVVDGASLTSYETRQATVTSASTTLQEQTTFYVLKIVGYN